MLAVAEGRADALRVLYGRHARWVFAQASRRLDRGAAEEVVQEVFLGIFRGREAFDPARGSFLAWLSGTTRRRIANELRRRSRKGGGEDVDLDSLPTGDPGPDEAAWRAYRSDVVARAVEALPEGQRRALRLAFFEDLSHEEIASMLHLPLGTAKTRIRSGLKKLGPALAALALAAALVWLASDEHRARGRDERALALVTASDAERLRLDAAPGVPAASHANYRHQASAPLAVITLSSLEPGQRYAVWAQIGGRTVALGTAAPDAGGKALLIAEDPALAGAPDAVWVTRGPATVLAWHRPEPVSPLAPVER